MHRQAIQGYVVKAMFEFPANKNDLQSMKAEYELQLDDLQAFVDFATPRSSKLPLYGSLLAYLCVLAYAFAVLPITSALMLLIPAFMLAMTWNRAMKARAPGRAKIKKQLLRGLRPQD